MPTGIMNRSIGRGLKIFVSMSQRLAIIMKAAIGRAMWKIANVPFVRKAAAQAK